MERIKTGILYLGLHNQLVKKYGNKIIHKRDFFIKIGRHAQIPKQIRPLVLIEMEERGLIEEVDKENVRALKIDIDLEKDIDELNKIAGL